MFSLDQFDYNNDIFCGINSPPGNKQMITLTVIQLSSRHYKDLDKPNLIRRFDLSHEPIFDNA